MEEVLAPIGNLVFDIERDLDEQVGALPLPFPGMDKSGSAICVFHLRGSCHRSSMCPFRHVKPDRTVVCKHWLRGLCKKGDSCEFLHEYDMSKMPECYFYSKFHACSNKECPFLHIDPESKVKDCPWYDRGFCRHGPHCRHRHARRVACLNYLCGFCPDGPNCKFVHMRFDIPLQGEGRAGGDRPDFRVNNSEDRAGNAVDGENQNQNRRMLGPMPTMGKRPVPICHHCNEPGHKVYTCDKLTPEERVEVVAKYQEEKRKNPFLNMNSQPFQQHEMNNKSLTGPGAESEGSQSTFRPLDQVTCYKCGTKGHYANKCPKGYLAFLSPALNNFRQPSPNNNPNLNNNNMVNNNNPNIRRPPLQRNQGYPMNNDMISVGGDDGGNCGSGMEPMDNS